MPPRGDGAAEAVANAYQMNPFISFCLYVAARVFVQYLKSRPDDAQTTDSLRFLLSAMNALKRRNPLTESFLVQLDVDFEALATRIPKLRNAFPRPGDSVSRPCPPGEPRDADAPQPGLAKTGNARTACDEPDGAQGILAYRDDCHFLKVPGDDGSAQDLVDAQRASQGPVAGGFGQAWFSAEQASMPGLTPTSGAMHHERGASTGGGPLSGFGEGCGDKAETRKSPETGLSGGPTPKSSGAGSDGRSHLAPGPGMGGGSGCESSSFRASPMSPPQSMMGQGAGLDAGGAAGFFGGPGDFATMAGGAMGGGTGGGVGVGGPQAGAGFGMASNGGWPGIGGQAAGMPPLGDGVLRALMDMGPMDAMDLSSWDSGNDAHMRG